MEKNITFDSKDKNNSKNNESLIFIDSCYIVNSSNLSQKINKYDESLNKNIKIYKILEFNKIIGKHKYQADFVKELKDNTLISSGTDNKLILYDQNYNIIKIKKMKNWVYSITEVNNDKSTSIIFCSIKTLIYIKDITNFYNLMFIEPIVYNFKKTAFFMCFYCGYSDFIICGNLIFFSKNLFCFTLVCFAFCLEKA